MLIFIDYFRRGVGLEGCYRNSAAPSWIHPNMPVDVLTGAVFLDAQYSVELANSVRLYHVERGEFIDANRLAETQVSLLDTLVVVNNDELAHDDSRVLDRMWQLAGCGSRRLEHSGMPLTERRALARYAN